MVGSAAMMQQGLTDLTNANASPASKTQIIRDLTKLSEEGLEGLFKEVQNVGKNVERLLAKTILGLCARLVAKMTSHLIKYVLRAKYGIDVISFSQASA